MSGALKSVFGGGNIFGSLLSLASLAFPPLAIAGSMSNLLTQAIGTAVKMAADTLMKEFGMPKFVRDIVNTVVDGAVSGNTTASEPDVDNFVEQQAGAVVQQFALESAQAIVHRAMAKMRSEGLETRSKARSGRAGSGSWLEAIAAAMGEVLGEKASKMVELSSKIASTAGEEGKSAAKANAAATTEMQATSQMFSLMQSGFSNTIKAIGEGLSQMARKG